MGIFITCDDFGLNSTTNKAILELARTQAIDGTSVLVTHAKESDLQELAEVKKSYPSLSVGLHLNLTEGKPLVLNIESSLVRNMDNEISFKGINSFLQSELLNPSMQTFEEIEAQVNLFKRYFNKIDHIDGHQHIQYLPSFYKKLKNWLEQKQLGDIPIRLAKFESTGLKPSLLNILTGWNKKNLTHNIYDLHQTNIGQLKELASQDNSENIVMAHVVHPKLKCDQSSLGSFNFENRVHQFMKIKELKGLV